MTQQPKVRTRMAGWTCREINDGQNRNIIVTATLEATSAFTNRYTTSAARFRQRTEPRPTYYRHTMPTYNRSLEQLMGHHNGSSFLTSTAVSSATISHTPTSSVSCTSLDKDPVANFLCGQRIRTTSALSHGNFCPPAASNAERQRLLC